MLIKFISLIALVFVSGFVTNAYAHTSEIILGYKVEVGWIEEPPLVGVKNGIEIFVTEATKLDLQLEKRSHDHSEDEAHDHSKHEDEDHDHSEHDHSENKNETLENESEKINDEISENDGSLLQETEKSVYEIIKQWEVHHISQYKAIRDIQLTLHENKIHINDYETLQIFSSIIDDVITGVKAYDLGMHSIKNVMDKRIEELKNTPSEEKIPEVEEPIAISGLADKIEVNVKIKNTKTFLVLEEDTEFPGRYVGKFTPLETGIPFVNVFLGTYGDREVELIFHPEDVEVTN